MSGQTVSVDRFAMERTYLGLIDGIPWDRNVDKRVQKAKEFVKNNWYGPEAVVIPPDVLGPDSQSPILPSMTLMAQLVCSDPRNTDEHGSWLNLIWSADEVEGQVIEDLVANALEKIDWNREAIGYLL